MIQPTRSLIATLIAAQLIVAMPAVAATGKQAGGDQQGIHLYRYVNTAGVRVTGTSISPEYARKGYEIVTMSGVVLETVAPEPTPEQRAEYEKRQQDKRTTAQQQEHDKELRLRYTSVAEIELARTRKLSEIDDKARMLNSNLSSIKQQIQQERERAAAFELNGQPVPAVVTAKIEDLQRELKVSEDQLATRQKELVDEGARFDSDIERFKVLEAKHGKRQ